MKFRGSINLMALKGAQVLNVTMPNGKQQACVVIPAAYNDMINKDGNVAPYLNLVAWEAGQKFIDACNSRHAGEEGYVAPSHTVDLSYGQEFRQRAEEAAKKRLLAENPALENNADELKREITKATRVQLGTLTPMEQRQQGYAAQGAAVAAEIPQAALPSNPSVPAGMAPMPENEDLPF